MPDEELQGYLVDIVCLRHYPPSEYGPRAREHTRACALEGHCVESGYALVTDDGQAVLLDEAATTKVLETVLASDRAAGIRLSVRRRIENGKMTTIGLREVGTPRDVGGPS